MTDGDRKNSRQLIGKIVVSRAGKRFGEVSNLNFEVRSGEIINVVVKNPTGYCEGMDLERNDRGEHLVPFHSVVAIGDFVVISEEDII